MLIAVMADSEPAQTGSEIEPTVAQYQALLEVSESIVLHRDLESLLRDLAKHLRSVVQFDGITVLLHNPERDTMRLLVVESIVDRPAAIPGELPAEGTPAGWVWRTQQPLLVHHTGREVRFPQMNQLLYENGVLSYCILPLTSAVRRLGALGFASRRELAFSEVNLELMQQVANQVAVAVDNALNAESAGSAQAQLARERDRFRLLLEVSNAVTAHLDLRELFAAISASLGRVIQFDGAGMTLYDAESGQLRAVALESQAGPEVNSPIEEGQLFPIEGTPAEIVIRSRQTCLIPRTYIESSTSPVVQQVAAQGIKAGCVAPLISHGRVLGTLDVVSRRENAFTEQDAELLTQIAGQIAIAVENALNFEAACVAGQQLARDRDRLRLLLQVNNALVSHLDLKELLTAISAFLQEVMPHDFVGIGLYDAETNQLRAHTVNFHRPMDFIVEGVPIPLDGTPAGLAFITGQPVLLKQPDPVRFPADVTLKLIEGGVKSGCSVPLIQGGRKLGIMGIGSLREAAFTEADVELLTQVAGQIALAVENAVNFAAVRAAETQMQRDRDRLSLLLNINNAIVSHLDLRDLIHLISSTLHASLAHDMIGLSLYDAEINQLRTYTYDYSDNKPFIEEGHPIPLEGSFTGLTFTSGKPVFMNIASSQFHSDFNRRFREAGFKSGGCVPLIAHGRKLGTLGVARYNEQLYSADEAELLCQIGNQVALALDNVLAYQEIEALKNKLSEEKLYLEEEINTVYNFEQIIGASTALRRILKQVETVAPTDSTVLIRGETGTGKELIARALHGLSARHERTLVKLNCAAIPTGLIESELFGHEKGAFTGAIAQRIGRFELANKGSLFLDEVGEIPIELQPKLLRVLQEQEFERLGSTRTIGVDIRLIAATNRDLEQMVAERQFRDDLYYRLNVFPITIPPLRERREDIPLLVRFFASKFARRMKKRIETIPSEAVAALQQYHWPGNIRELENFIERAVILTQGAALQVPLNEMKLPVKPAPMPATTRPPMPAEGTADSPSLESVEREHILRVLTETDWIVGGPNGAAARLGLKRTTLQARMKKLGIARHRTAP